MSIADKLLTIANNTPAVADTYHASKATVSGDVIRVDDVLATEHPLQVTAASESEVKVYGKNLANPSLYTTDGNKSVVVYVGDGVLRHRASTTGSAGLDVNGTRVTLQMLCPDIEVGKTYTLNATTTCESKKYIYLQGNYNKTWNFGKSLTITEAMLTDGVLWYSMGDRVDVFISNIQIELGTAATAYEPYKAPQTATADTDGTVHGLKSVSPTMTIVGNSVECTYFPASAADTLQKCQQISEKLITLKEELA